MSSLSPIAQNSAASNLSNTVFSASFPNFSSSPGMSTVSQNPGGNVPLPADLDLASAGIGLPTVYVKPQHLNYLRDFRTQQCPLFANHKCTQHKPFTCFHWHFPNQRRRRPLRQSDGTFSYSPDVYCDKYDETRGECPNVDACPYLHRNAGDTERRYHLRYFKTGTCIHDTDPRGHCSRNGAHCAFAHGANDLRVPVYDIREVQEASECPVNLPASLEKERVLSEDPKWNDMAYVLANYKTDQCKKPPRMCRQGYACPFFHNSKDRRRGPHLRKYRSTPCPTVKNSEEWLDSSLCEHIDDCQYCHTRTEQQFHPEIYKSTKCNDVMQQSYCPRGPFCAFAHDDTEMNFGRSFMQEVELQLANSSRLQLQLQQQQQQQQQMGSLPQSRLMSPSLWSQSTSSPPSHLSAAPGAGAAAAGAAAAAAASGGGAATGSAAAAAAAALAKGRTASGTSHTSAESGLGSMCRGDSPINASKLLLLSNQRRAVNSPSSSAMLPDLEDADLPQLENASSEGSDSLSPLTVMTSGTGPIGIPGAASPGFNPLTYPAANQPTDANTLPFQSFYETGAQRSRRRVNSGGDKSSASSTYAQSPILMSNSPFSNPSMDLERLQYQQEIDRAQEEARRMRDAMQRAQRERDEAQMQLEAVRLKLRDISTIADHSPNDLSHCSAQELEQLKLNLQEHLQSVQQQLSQPDRSPPQSLNLGSSVDSLGFSSSLATVEENSGDVTPNVVAADSAVSAGSNSTRFTFARDAQSDSAEK